MTRPTIEPIGLQLSRTAKVVSRAFDDVLVAAGASLPTWLVLVSLKAQRHGMQRELAEAVGIEGPTLTHHLNRMEASGLVTRTRDPQNRRVHRVELTDEGEATFDRLRDAVLDFDRRLRKGVTATEITALGHLLARLRLNVADPADHRGDAVKLILHLSHFNWPVAANDLPGLLTDVAGLAEQGDFEGVAVADHLWQHPIMGGPEANCLEAYSTLAFLAAHTSSVRLLTLATGAHFRHPAVLAKTVTTLDVLSGGRAWLGIGAGHYQEECDGLGVPFPPLSDRFEVLEDALEICTRMWEGSHGEDGPFTGHHVSATRLLNVPQALQRPRPPILIAGDGERRTLPLVARYADACSLRPSPDIPAKLDVLRRHCDDAGTDFERIERTCAFAFDPDDDGPATKQLLEQLRWLAELGIDTVIGRVDGDDPRTAIERLSRHVVPEIASEVRR